MKDIRKEQGRRIQVRMKGTKDARKTFCKEESMDARKAVRKEGCKEMTEVECKEKKMQ